MSTAVIRVGNKELSSIFESRGIVFLGALYLNVFSEYHSVICDFRRNTDNTWTVCNFITSITIIRPFGTQGKSAVQATTKCMYYEIYMGEIPRVIIVTSKHRYDLVVVMTDSTLP